MIALPRRHPLALAGALAGALALLGGCVAPGDAGQAASTASSPPSAPGAPLATGRAAIIAEALVMAERAEHVQDTAALAQALDRLDRLGATPQSEEDAAARQRWQASLPADTRPLRGRALGPAYRSGSLRPGASAELFQTFLGGKSAQIVLKVAKGPAPRLVVHDMAERRVCQASDDPVACRWVPLYTQRHRIEIVNSGPEPSQYYIVFD